MQLTHVPKALLAPITTVISAVTGGVPTTTEPKAMRPAQRAEIIAKRAAAKAAAISGSLALPSGPVALLTLVPDLLMVWRIQAQMVADIASAYGRKEPLTQEELMACLLTHVSSTALKEYNKNLPLEHPEPPTSIFELIQRATNKGTEMSLKATRQISSAIAERAIRSVITRMVPLAGAAVVSAYAAFDTQEVARTAMEFFSGEKTPPSRRRLKHTTQE